jgi:branched-chain amino acid transport system substrate-binding protein
MKKRYLLVGLLALVVVLALGMLAVACNEEETTETTGTTATGTETTGAATGEPIKIGFIGDLTGREGTTGQNMEKSLRLAFEVIGNRIGDRPVEIIAEDAADKANVAVDKARKLVEQDQVVAIFGPNEIGEKFAVAGYVASLGDAGIPLIYFSPTPADAFAGNDWLIGACGTNVTQPTCMADYVYNDLGWATIDTLGQEGAAGQSFVGPLVGVYEQLGGTVASQVWPPADTADFAPFLTTLDPADGLVAWMPGAAVGLFIQYVKMGVNEGLPMAGPFHGATFDPWVYAAINANNPDVAEAMAGVPCPMEYSPDSTSEANQAFLEAAKAAWGEDNAVSGDLVNTFNAAQLFIKALEDNGGVTTPAELMEALLSTEWEGPQGPAFFAEGDRAATINVYIVAEQPTPAGTKYPYQYVTLKTYEAVPPTGFAVAGAAATETGVFFEDLGGGKVHITTVPGPGMKFDISTEGGFAVKIEAFDASGGSLGLLECPDAAKGVVDYSSLEGVAKIVVTDVPHGNVEYEYTVQ